MYAMTDVPSWRARWRRAALTLLALPAAVAGIACVGDVGPTEAPAHLRATVDGDRLLVEGPGDTSLVYCAR